MTPTQEAFLLQGLSSWTCQKGQGTNVLGFTKRTCHFRGLKLYTHCIGRSKKMSTWKYIKDERPVTRNYPLNISTELSFDCFNHSVSHVIIFMVSTLQASSQRMNIVRKKDKISVGLATKILSFYPIHFDSLISFHFDSFHLQSSGRLWPSKLYKNFRWKKVLEIGLVKVHCGRFAAWVGVGGVESSKIISTKSRATG